MKRSIFYLLGLCLVCLQAGAGVLPPEKLLPRDTVFLMTIPDAAKSLSDFTNSTYGRLWNDPAMKAFKDKMIDNCRRELIGPTERELGIKLADYRGFARGQLTFALLQNEDKADSPFTPLLLMDSKDRAEQLKKSLADARKKWVEAGKAIRTVDIRGIPFTGFITTRGDLSNTLSKVFGPVKSNEENDAAADDSSEGDNSAAAEKIEILFGQSDSLLIVGESIKSIEKVLNRQAGGLVPALDEDPAFHADYEAHLRGVPAYAWINAKMFLNPFARQDGADSTSNLQKILAGIGLLDVKTAALTWKTTPEGFVTQFFAGIPEANRRGVFKILTTEARDAAPPSFIPADVTEFMRWRLDLPQTWTGLENMLGDINPTARGIISFVIDAAGKSKDPNYNLKTELLGSLGNDVIFYQKVDDKTSAGGAPTLILIGSPKADKLAAALNVAIGALGAAATVKESDFQGRTLYTVASSQGTGAATRFVANGSYLAISTDIGILEEYLRNTDNKTKSLAEVAGLKEASQKVGGMNTGLFGYTDQRKGLKVTLEKLRNSGNFGDLIASAALRGKNGAPDLSQVNSWADFSLLPPYEALSKYFYFTVYSVSFNADGFVMTYFAPNPPQAKAQ